MCIYSCLSIYIEFISIPYPKYFTIPSHIPSIKLLNKVMNSCSYSYCYCYISSLFKRENLLNLNDIESGVGEVLLSDY